MFNINSNIIGTPILMNCFLCNTKKTQMKKITEKSHFPSKQTYPGLQYTIPIEKIEIYYERERERGREYHVDWIGSVEREAAAESD